MFCYSTYEFLVHSELELPELIPTEASGDSPDVRILLSEAIPDLPDATLRESYFQVSPASFRLAVEGVAVYLIEGGRTISIQQEPGVDPAQVRLFLLGSAMGALHYQRGTFPLHGCAVETPWGAMVFVGPSGIGKSTLAAHFQARGYRLLSDDVCVITRNPEGLLRVLPAFPHLRLCGDALDRMRGKESAASGGGSTARFDVDKFILPLGPAYCPVAAPLGRVHVLLDSQDDKLSLTPLRGFDRVQKLVENLYRPHYLKGMQSQGDVMRLAGEIASTVEVLGLSRPRDAARLDDLVLWLEDGWKGQTGPSPSDEA